MWRYYLSKVIDWIKYALVFGLIFIIGKNVYANGILENFDNYANNTAIASQSSYWSTSATITAYPYTTNFVSYSSPMSLYITGTASSGQTSYARYINNDLTWNSLSFYIRFSNLSTSNITPDSSIYIAHYPDNTRILTLYYTNAGVYLSNGSSTATTTIFSGSLPLNNWLNFSISYNSFNSQAQGCYAGSCSSFININGLTSNKITFASRPDMATYYIDDLSINNFNTLDYISINYPAKSQILNIQNFYWQYSFHIASTSEYTLFNKLGVSVGFNHLDSLGNPTSTTTISFFADPITNFTPLTDYIFQETNASTFPTQQGVYDWVLGLYGYTSTTSIMLAYDAGYFAIASSTVQNNSAWCSNLCIDLTATSSPAWWQFWNWNTDTLGGTIMCSGRYLICYAFYPHNFTTQVFNDSYTSFQQAIPFNIIYDIASTTQSVFASTSLSTKNTFGMPMIDNTGKHIYIMPLLTSSSTANLIGNNNATIFRNSLTYLIYSAYVVGAILIIF